LRHRCSNVANFLGVLIELFCVLVCITTFTAFKSHVGVIVVFINVHGCNRSIVRWTALMRLADAHRSRSTKGMQFVQT
jgi:hypothetical protein